ncbi:Phage integrase family protein [Pseudobutyrivibrio sp. UC1225]|nr:Phage integrase family protein [Pseudobutyrivibrio sp. UC1225]
MLETQREFLNVQLSLGIIDTDGVSKELNLISKKEKDLRDRLVFMSHVTNDGKLRAISHHVPTQSNPKDYYITKMPAGKKIKATTYDGLLEKLYDYYTAGIKDYSLESVFNAALHEKAVTENPKENTIAKNRVDFNHYISKELAKKDIRKISDIDLKQYTQEWVNREHPKQKAFFSYKGVLNLGFGYAYAHKIISTNPVAMIKNKPYMKSCNTRKAKPEETILSPDEIDIIRQEVRYRMTKKKWGSYYINGYAVLFAIETGVRVGELCAIKWEDISEYSIHIHAQQLSKKENGKKVYYYDTCTKNEKGISRDGREFPLTKKIKSLLLELKEKQMTLGIESEFIFCHEDGDWIKKDAYETFLRRLCQSKGFHVTNNHALRMSLNSNVLFPMGISVADRVAMLGHSIQTNLQFYSFAQKGYLENVRDILDSQDNDGVGTLRAPHKIIRFFKKESPESLISQTF